MSKTINCRELGGFDDCDFEITVPNDDLDMLVDTTISHAKRHHPQAVSDEASMAGYIRTQVKDLYRQAHYTEPAHAEA